MDQKGFANNIIIGIIVVILLGVAGYFVLVKQPAPTQTPQTSQSIETDAPSATIKEGGAGGSGLAEFPLTSKYCKDRSAPKEKIFGETLTINSDKKNNSP